MITSAAYQETRLDEQIIRLYLSGFRQDRIPERLGLPRDRVNKTITDYKAKARAQVPVEGLLHPWLEPEDEANVHGAWVPSPEELTDFYEQQRKLREAASTVYLERRMRKR